MSTSLVAFLPEDNGLRSAMLPLLDAITFTGGAGLGLSLTQIHIYVAPIKRTLQALWALGFVGERQGQRTQDGVGGKGS